MEALKGVLAIAAVAAAFLGIIWFNVVVGAAVDSFVYFLVPVMIGCGVVASLFKRNK